ncbi:MAG: FRG domain-containing protein, partial [Fibrobacter sp.]|nr:FRG domain-containing protein [Fibrobacter sp.]
MRTIHSIAELLDCLKQIEREGLEGHRENVCYYYRGEAEDYGPTGATPSIARNGRLKKEAENFRETERHLPDEFAACRSTFEKLVLMQHYQIPTRLLDVTTSALQAVFFACYNDPDYGMSDEKEGCRDGVVYVYEVPKDKIKNYHSDAVSILANIAVYQHEDNLD